MKRVIDYLPTLTGVRSRVFQLDCPFDALAARFAHEPGCVVLLSGSDLDCARYHIMALHPWLTLCGRHGLTQIVLDGTAHCMDHSPLDVLDAVLGRCRLATDEKWAPVTAGLFGYLAYDLKDNLETLPRTSMDDLNLPHLYWVAPSLIVVHDKIAGTTVVHAPVREDRDVPSADTAIADFLSEIKQPAPASGSFSGDGRPMVSNFSKSEYEAAVQRIREYIAAGDVYQVNFSQRFEMGFNGDAFSLFRSLYQMNPAPFFAFVNAGDHQIVSTSPERFLMQRGRQVETRPIKGTRPRGKTPDADRAMQAELSGSPKDDAELSMIVDLLRNDIGRACTGGSVTVTEHKRLEAYQNVYHLVSVVDGILADGNNSVDLIRATFPGGSITGCPKIRSMEIIDELESHRRHVYTGSIGYIGFHDTMDLSIAIRTATIVGDRLLFSVGGGIVYDSDPADEFAETLHKGETLMRVFQGTARQPNSDKGPWVWQNGRLTVQDKAAVSTSDLGVQYGFGFFETIRVEKGIVCRLAEHLSRFNRSWADLFGGPVPDLTWSDVIDQVIDKNGLADTTTAVKILATRGDSNATVFNGTLLVTARPYTHRLEALGLKGLRLVTYPHARLTPLADHKTLNYLYYYRAGAWALEHDAHEALILNPDHSVSETNTANLLVISGQTVTCPVSPHVLPGVMQAAACQWFSKNGYAIVDRPLDPDALFHADMVLLTNALMGAVPAVGLDGRTLSVDTALCEALNEGLVNA
ncbi:aminodeoxychorismate synthase component I [Desulfosarcina variabilis]|uniref:aminodeoxychorismate synthase component I n=1 Tax=Desulfosarcina variabilis TaxID=2300 RepID=UPI003AFAB53E